MLFRMSTALRRVGRLLTLLACMALPAVCLARREVPVFTVSVTAKTPAALAQAMRAVLVRATGHGSAAQDPQLSPLVAHAAQYVQSYQHGPAGGLRVTFDAAALEQAISAAGRNLWNAERPFTLVVLSPPPGTVQQAADAAAVQQAAEARGLPISIVPLTVREANGQLLGTEALLSMVHNLGAEQLLVGRDLGSPSVPGGASSSMQNASLTPPAPAGTSSPADAPPAGAAAAPAGGATPPDTWRWTLVTPFIRRQFTGSISAGIDSTVDLLAPPVQASAAGGVAKTPVRVEGLKTLDDYARVETMLAAVPGVHHSTVARVGSTTVVFDLWARGGASAVSRMLAISARFKPVAGADTLTYRYVPPPPASAAAPSRPSAPQAPPAGRPHTATAGSPAAAPP